MMVRESDVSRHPRKPPYRVVEASIQNYFQLPRYLCEAVQDRLCVRKESAIDFVPRSVHSYDKSAFSFRVVLCM